MTIKALLLAAAAGLWSTSGAQAEQLSDVDPIDRYECISQNPDGSLSAQFSTSQRLVDENIRTVAPYSHYTTAESDNRYKVEPETINRIIEADDRRIEHELKKIDENKAGALSVETLADYEALIAEQHEQYDEALEAIDLSEEFCAPELFS